MGYGAISLTNFDCATFDKFVHADVAFAQMGNVFKYQTACFCIND